MKRIISGLLLAFALLAATPAAAQQADDASKRLALSHRFIELMQTDQMGAMLGQMSAAFAPAPTEDMTEAETADYQALMEDMMAVMLPRLFDAMAPIYADIFTLEELEGLVAFYESDIGQSMMRKSYESAPRITTAIQAMMPQLMVEMGDMICDRYNCTPDERREMKVAMGSAMNGSVR